MSAPPANRNAVILPCPFCGVGKVGAFARTCDVSTPYNPADRAYPVVRCQCGAEVAGKNWGEPETAIAAWNRRALQTAPQEGATPRTNALFELEKRNAFNDYWPAFVVMADFARQLERELIAAQRDAERYRWLRGRTRGQRDHSDASPRFDLPHVAAPANLMQGSVAEHLDNAIDAAMKGST